MLVRPRAGARDAPAPFLRPAALVTYTSRADASLGHDRIGRRRIARHIAGVIGCPFAGEYDPAARYPRPLYFVPEDTVPSAIAATLGIRSQEDLFGGVVPWPFVATKIITHPLVRRDARAPEGWSQRFSDRVGDAALPGFAAFSPDDARRAAAALLPNGPVRIKRATGVGGGGQHVATTASGVDDVLATIDPGEVAVHGVAVEQHLGDVTTYSIGQLQVNGQFVSYCGEQRLTRNNHDGLVYGGTDLLVARGDWDSLCGLELFPAERRAVELARRYDRAAAECYEGFYASRRNYDVAEGTDARGKRCCGVLEQSWRIGGASGAESVALAALRDEPARACVRTLAREVYGSDPAVPSGAFVYYCGTDPKHGPLTKYAAVVRDADAR
jgi:hypothetical protein